MDEPLKEPGSLPPSYALLADASTLNLQPEAFGGEPSLDELKARLAAIERSHGIIEFTPDGVIDRVNDHYLKLTGYPREALLGQHHSLLCPPDYVASDEYRLFWQRLRQGQPCSGRFPRRGHQGRHYWIQASYTPLIGNDGRVSRIVKYAHDVTQSVETEQKVLRQGELLDIMLSAQDGFLLDHNLAGACDKLFSRLLGVTESEFGFIGIVQGSGEQACLYLPSISNLSWNETTREWYERQSRSRSGLIFSNLNNLFGHVVTHNTTVCTNHLPSHPASRGFPPGHPQLYSFLGIPVTYGGRAIGMIALANRQKGYDESVIQQLEPLVATLGTLIHARTLEDERNRMESDLRFSASHDFLTQLPNRSLFFEQASALFAGPRRRQAGRHCLALLDIDHFKRINDEHGHLVGDAVLKGLARLLLDTLREQDLVARVGGEEFAVLLHDVSLDNARNTLERLRLVVADHPFICESLTLHLTISAGVTPYRPTLVSVDDWLQEADHLLYGAKHKGRNRVESRA